MATYDLGLPTDIPWKRICVTQDMLDNHPCDDTRPNPWRHSIAIFRYDPPADYQPEDLSYKISYLKVAVTITPWAPTLSTMTKNQLVPFGAVDDLEQTYPVYGGLLQVTVAPPTALQDSTPLTSYPYFADFEPKRREIYESVTDAGQVLSGSRSALSVGKSAQTTDSTQNYDIDNGWNFSMSIPDVGGIGAGASGQYGNVGSNTVQNSDVTTSDSSTDRRETSSHVTQLSQMYNLFQAFHVGTNRALFFMEPRPHVVQSDATFINGPRRLEGIQEIFMVVITPGNPNTVDFCVSALLETAHLTTDIVLKKNYKIASYTKTFSPGQTNYYIPFDTGWVLDTSRADGGVEISYISGTPDSVTITVDETIFVKRVHGAGGIPSFVVNSSNGNVTVGLIFHYVSVNNTMEQTQSLFLVARDLCCCSTPPTPLDHWISYEHDLSETAMKMPIVDGPATTEALQQSRMLANLLHSEMLRSTTSSDRRYNRGDITFEQSDAFMAKLANYIDINNLNAAIAKPVASAPALTPEGRDVLGTLYSSTPLLDVLKSDALQLAQKTGTTRSKILQYKSAALTALRPAAPMPPSAQPLRSVIAVRVASSYTNPDKPLVLAQMVDPNEMLAVDVTRLPDIIEVDFSGAPDSGSLSSSTFTVTRNGSAVAGQVSLPTSTKARFTFFEPIQPGGLYTVTLRGDTPAIKFLGRRLDGEASRLPSGDGVEGGNFEFIIRGSVPAFPFSPSVQVTKLKVTGVRIRTATPDPINPRILAEMTDPGLALQVTAADQPNIIEVDFNAHPDDGTITTSSFAVTEGGSVPGTITMVTATKARFTSTTPLAPGSISVKLHGTTSPIITYQGQALDGEPTALPSGNNTAGGDFSFTLLVV